MSYEYKIDKKRNIVFVHFTSYLDDKLLLASFNKIYADPEYMPVLNQCINYADITDLSITRFGVESLVRLSENFECLNTNWKTYIVAPDDLVFGYGRMYQLLVDGSNEEVCIVRTLEEAVKLMEMSVEKYPFQQEKLGEPP